MGNVVPCHDPRIDYQLCMNIYRTNRRDDRNLRDLVHQYLGGHVHFVGDEKSTRDRGVGQRQILETYRDKSTQIHITVDKRKTDNEYILDK